MALALGTGAVVLVVLSWELLRPTLRRWVLRVRVAWASRRLAAATTGYDPGRERRAEQRARALLRSCISEQDWEMYSDLGFLRVTGRLGELAHAASPAAVAGAAATAGEPGPPGVHPVAEGQAAYAYLIYPHKPIVAYVPATGELLNEYCVAFPDHSRPYGSARLPHSDDVLAKWMALTADERRLIGEANMHLPGRQIEPDRVRRDIARLERWERQRRGHAAGNVRAA